MHAKRSTNLIPRDFIALTVFGEVFFFTLTMKIKEKKLAYNSPTTRLGTS